MLKGIDLGGKLTLVTGGYSGTGLETTRGLAGIDNTKVAELDLADLDSVRASTRSHDRERVGR